MTKVAIIGAGAMGTWLADFAKRNLGEIIIADKDKRKARRLARKLKAEVAESNEDAAAKADVVIVAVPMSVTIEVIQSVAEHVKSRSLLMDVASAKGDVVDRMKGLKPDIELVSLHPLFGPGAKDVKNKIFVSVLVRAGERYLELKKVLEGLGAKVVEMGGEEHDRLMAITQCLTHFLLISYINTLNSMKYSKKARETPTPMSVALLELAKSILAGNPEVYGELQVSNRYAKMVRSKFMESCRGLDLALSAHDVKDVQKVFDEALTSWGKKETKEAYKRLYKKFEKVMKK